MTHDGDSILRVNRSRNLDAPLYALKDDDRLSWKAVGLLTYLVTRPDGWKFFKADLISRHDDGKTSVESGLEELREAGYLSMDQERGEDGTFRTRWKVTDTPPDVDRTGKSGAEAGKSCRTGLSAPDYPRAENRGTEVIREEGDGEEGDSSSSGLRPSRDGRPAEEQNREEVSPESWYREGLELGADATDLDQERSYHLAVGVTRLLWRTDAEPGEADPPEKAPRREYTPWADVGKLRDRLKNTSYREALEVVVGLASIREQDELGGVDPGEPLTLGYLDWSASNGQRSLWARARDAGREVLHDGQQRGSLLDELAEEVVADVA